LTEKISFDGALERLEEIVKVIQDKDLDLEKSLDFLEEGIELANLCTKNIDEAHLKS